MSSSLLKKLLLSTAVVGAAAGMAGLGTYATWTDTATGAQSVSSGTVDINLGANGTDNRLSVAATGLVPGDTIQRRVKLTNAGSQALAGVALTTVATTSSTLDTDTADGLQMKIERCVTTLSGSPAGWVESLGEPYTYSCPAGSSPQSVLAERDIIGSNLALSNMAALTAGGTDDLVVTVTLPTSGTGTSLQGKSSVIEYRFTGTQRAGTAK